MLATSTSPPPPRPFPLWTFVGVISVILAYFISINVIFPYVPFMIEDFFPHLGAQNVGKYAGYLESAFFFGNVVASMLWSRFSDAYGRRPALVLGLIGSVVASISFGMSKTFAMALIVRFLWGVLDGTYSMLNVTRRKDVLPQATSVSLKLSSERSQQKIIVRGCTVYSVCFVLGAN